MSTRGIVARGKPAYDDATEIYGRSAHPFGLAPEYGLPVIGRCNYGFSSRMKEFMCRGRAPRPVSMRRSHWRTPRLT